MKCYFCGHEMIVTNTITTPEEMEEYEIENDAVIMECLHCHATASIVKSDDENTYTN